MLSIRFVRIGKKRHPIYRIVVMEKGKNPHSTYLENLGTYNPHTKEKNIKKDRVDYWVSKGANLTATIHNLFVDQGFITYKKVRASKSKPGKKKQAQIAIKKSEEEATKKNQEAEKVAAEAAAKEAVEQAAPEIPAETEVKTEAISTEKSE